MGVDDGAVVIKIGREEPAVSMENSGTLTWARHTEILSSVIKWGDSTIKDGSPLSLPSKDLGNCEIYPQTLSHSPNDASCELKKILARKQKIGHVFYLLPFSSSSKQHCKSCLTFISSNSVLSTCLSHLKSIFNCSLPTLPNTQPPKTRFYLQELLNIGH